MSDHYGHSLAARALRFHQWRYDPTLPARPQLMNLERLLHSWLEEGDGPPIKDRLLLDHCIRALPRDAKLFVAQQNPQSVDVLITLLENHAAMLKLMKTTGRSEARKRPNEGGKKKGRVARTPPPVEEKESGHRFDPRRCFGCGERGHLVQGCPGDDVRMEKGQ